MKRLCGLRSLQEVGYGSGDSTILLNKEFSPKSYVGYTSLAAQQRIAGALSYPMPSVRSTALPSSKA